MYEPLDKDSSDAASSTFANTSDQRDKFLSDLLGSHLKADKLKEKQQICDKLKYKKHQLEVAIKQLKKEKKIKNTKRKKNLTCKLKKSLNLYKLDKEEKRDYNEFKAMNELWKQYINKVLLGINEKSIESTSEETILTYLKQADYHGAIIKVVRSKCKNLIGLNGIVLQEKRFVFVILTKANVIKTVPKMDNLFEFEINNCKLTLIGSNMCMKPELRVTKFIKPKDNTNIF